MWLAVQLKVPFFAVHSILCIFGVSVVAEQLRLVPRSIRQAYRPLASNNIKPAVHSNGLQIVLSFRGVYSPASASVVSVACRPLVAYIRCSKPAGSTSCTSTPPAGLFRESFCFHGALVRSDPQLKCLRTGNT